MKGNRKKGDLKGGDKRILHIRIVCKILFSYKEQRTLTC